MSDRAIKKLAGFMFVGLMIAFIVSVILGATIYDVGVIPCLIQGVMAAGCYVIAYHLLADKETSK